MWTVQQNIQKSGIVWYLQLRYFSVLLATPAIILYTKREMDTLTVLQYWKSRVFSILYTILHSWTALCGLEKGLCVVQEDAGGHHGFAKSASCIFARFLRTSLRGMWISGIHRKRGVTRRRGKSYVRLIWNPPGGGGGGIQRRVRKER